MLINFELLKAKGLNVAVTYEPIDLKVARAASSTKDIKSIEITLVKGTAPIPSLTQHQCKELFLLGLSENEIDTIRIQTDTLIDTALIKQRMFGAPHAN